MLRISKTLKILNILAIAINSIDLFEEAKISTRQITPF